MHEMVNNTYQFPNNIINKFKLFSSKLPGAGKSY